ARQILFGNAWARIAHRAEQHAICAIDNDDNRRAGRAVFVSVGDQIDEYLHAPQAVAFDPQRAGDARRPTQLNRARCEQVVETIKRLAHQFFPVAALEFQHDALAPLLIYPQALQHASDQLVELADRVADALRTCLHAVWVSSLARKTLGAGVDHSQRRTQLMRHHRDKVSIAQTRLFFARQLFEQRAGLVTGRPPTAQAAQQLPAEQAAGQYHPANTDDQQAQQVLVVVAALPGQVEPGAHDLLADGMQIH